jgi:hypothetical protein
MSLSLFFSALERVQSRNAVILAMQPNAPQNPTTAPFPPAPTPPHPTPYSTAIITPLPPPPFPVPAAPTHGYVAPGPRRIAGRTPSCAACAAFSSGSSISTGSASSTKVRPGRSPHMPVGSAGSGSPPTR